MKFLVGCHIYLRNTSPFNNFIALSRRADYSVLIWDVLAKSPHDHGFIDRKHSIDYSGNITKPLVELGMLMSQQKTLTENFDLS